VIHIRNPLVLVASTAPRLLESSGIVAGRLVSIGSIILRTRPCTRHRFTDIAKLWSCALAWLVTTPYRVI